MGGEPKGRSRVEAWLGSQVGESATGKGGKMFDAT